VGRMRLRTFYDQERNEWRRHEQRELSAGLVKRSSFSRKYAPATESAGYSIGEHCSLLAAERQNSKLHRAVLLKFWENGLRCSRR
jgi:hypothetical protein